MLKVRPEAFERLLRLLNDPANEQRLVDAEALGLPALARTRAEEGRPF